MRLWVCIEVEEGEAVWIEPGCLCPKAPSSCDAISIPLAVRLYHPPSSLGTYRTAQFKFV